MFKKSLFGYYLCPFVTIVHSLSSLAPYVPLLPCRLSHCIKMCLLYGYLGRRVGVLTAIKLVHVIMHCPLTNTHKIVDPPEIRSHSSFFFHENETINHAPDKPLESVHRSSPLASHGLVAPPGLHGFQFQGKGWG